MVALPGRQEAVGLFEQLPIEVICILPIIVAFARSLRGRCEVAACHSTCLSKHCGGNDLVATSQKQQQILEKNARA